MAIQRPICTRDGLLNILTRLLNNRKDTKSTNVKLNTEVTKRDSRRAKIVLSCMARNRQTGHPLGVTITVATRSVSFPS